MALESSSANAARFFEVSLVPVEKDTGCKVHASFSSSAFLLKKDPHYGSCYIKGDDSGRRKDRNRSGQRENI